MAVSHLNYEGVKIDHRDADGTRIIQKAGKEQRRTLIRLLTRAKTEAELSPDVDLDHLADFFESTVARIRMMAKAGKSRQSLRNIAAFAGRAYVE